MTNDAIDAALDEVERARKRVAKWRSKQITRVDDVDYLKAVAYAWFKSHRSSVTTLGEEAELTAVDTAYRHILDATAKQSARTTYVRSLKAAKAALTVLRSVSLVSAAPGSRRMDPPPSFSPLAGDVQMRGILERRWAECERCLEAGAHLAATVMMGGLLEALFVARANQLPNKKPLFTSKFAPLDHKTKNPLPLTQWTLRPYIDVGHELGWISSSGKEVAAVLRDYRNYVHPEKERSHGVVLTEHDSRMFWEVTKSLTRQLLST